MFIAPMATAASPSPRTTAFCSETSMPEIMKLNLEIHHIYKTIVIQAISYFANGCFDRSTHIIHDLNSCDSSIWHHRPIAGLATGWGQFFGPVEDSGKGIDLGYSAVISSGTKTLIKSEEIQTTGNCAKREYLKHPQQDINELPSEYELPACVMMRYWCLL